MMRIVFEIYFFIGAAIAGYSLKEDFIWSKSTKDRVFAIVVSIITVLVWFPFAVVGFGTPFLAWLFRPLHIRFWWKYWFTKKLHNVDHEILRNVNNDIINRLKEDNSLSNRISKYCVDLVNKRNNFKL